MFGNMGEMMKKVQKLQSDMEQMKEGLKKHTVETSVGGGAVSVVLTGEKILKSCKIAPEAIKTEDKEMLEDLIVAAVNEAMGKVDEMLKTEMGKLTGGMNLPPGLF